MIIQQYKKHFATKIPNVMFNFISGTIFGIIVATIGFAPVAKTLDGMMLNIQKTASEMNRPELPAPSYR